MKDKTYLVKITLFDDANVPRGCTNYMLEGCDDVFATVDNANSIIEDCFPDCKDRFSLIDNEFKQTLIEIKQKTKTFTISIDVIKSTSDYQSIVAKIKRYFE